MSAGGAALERAVGERALRDPGDPALAIAIRRMAQAAGASLVGLVFFGSRCSGAARADAWSAYDLFVVVDGYQAFYGAMARAGLSGKRPPLLAAMSGWLPPTQYSLRFEPEGVHVKAAVLRAETWRGETSPRRRDHFVIGRLCQPTRILHSRDEEARRLLVEGLLFAHRETWSWARPWLPGTFDADAYGLSVLRTSMRWEVRPEPEGRANALWEAQKQMQVPVFQALLGELAERGEITPVSGPPGTFAPARPVGRAERIRRERYFRRSMARATARWLKHTASFEGWLEYIVRKASRHAGEPVTLTERERRWPRVFLWGRLFRYFRDRNRAGGRP